MDTSTSFGYWLRRQRKALDLTQQVLAERVGCSLAAIKKIESDERRPSRQIAERLAIVLGLPADQRQAFLETSRGVRPADKLFLANEPAAPSLPTGTVTLLYTDIESSTRLWAEFPEAMAVSCARHDQIVREAIQSNGGYVFQVVGDSFCAAFHTAGDALRAAEKAQLDLHGENWGEAPIRVRIGLHTGKVELQQDGSYRGYVTLSHAQRLMAAGHGGQVLISFATQELVQGELGDEIELRNLGAHRLRSFDHPEPIFQLVLPSLLGDFASLDSQDVLPNNLPAQLTSFIGRERELDELKRLLPGTRLLTLTGPGGTGKTRLALRLAADVLESFEQGVWLVELAPLANPSLVPQTVAAALEVREQPGRTIGEALTDYLRAKTMLLVLDNCEHLIGACAHLADALLRTGPGLKILATSRESLGIPGETTYQVPPLESPPVAQASEIRAEELAEYAAARLFTERARDFLSSFRLTNTNASAVAQICRRLDGMPLAIELAAARVRALPVEEIAARLNDRFRLLTDGGRTVLPRHQTLRSLIDWSHGLLTDHEQILMRRLSVFAGGWTLPAAEQVCSGAGLESDEILDLLAHLVNKSLVSLEQGGMVSRYRMLETIREYAREKLEASLEMQASRQRHRDYFIALAREAEPELKGTEQIEWLDRLEADHENLRMAWDCAIDSDPGLALELTSALLEFWLRRGNPSEGRLWSSRLLERFPDWGEAAQRARIFGTEGWLAFFQHDYAAARRALEQSLASARVSGDKKEIAFALQWLGWTITLGWKDPQAAQELLDECLAVLTDLADQWGIAMATFHAALLAGFRGRFGDAEEWGSRSLSLFRELGDKYWISGTLNNLGEVARAQGDYERAGEFYERCRQIDTELRSLVSLARDAGNFAWVLVHRGETQKARASFEEGLRLSNQYGNKDYMITSLCGLSAVLGLTRKAEQAARLLGAVESLFQTIGRTMGMEPADQREFDYALAVVRAQLDEAGFETGWAQGRAMTLEQATAFALEESRV